MNDNFLDAVGLVRYVGSWTLNALDSSVTFGSSSMWGLVRIRGHFARLEGEGHIGPDGQARGRLVLHAASLDTENVRRDDHLRSVDFFSVDSYPDIVFDLTSIEVTGLPERVRIDGTLTIIGHSKPVVLDAEIIGEDNVGLTLHAIGSVDRSLWGIGYKRVGTSNMDTRFEVFARFIRTEYAPS
jgi:polyisoprenoid-binding protein YceI